MNKENAQIGSCQDISNAEADLTRWGWFSGCQMNYNGRWIDYDKWRVFE